MFLFKKIVAPFFQPIPLCLSLLLLGLFFLIFTRKKKTGKVLVGIGTLILAIFSYSGASDMLVNPLEEKYPPISGFEELKDIKWIVVLGGGSGVDPALPLSTYLSAASLVRLSEAIRIHNKLPQTRLVFTGGSGFKGFTPVAEVMADMAVELGIRRDKIIIEPKAADTSAHPSYVKQIIGRDKFILVTSALHMYRAVAFFNKHGMYPIVAPTGYISKQREGFSPGFFFPDASSLEKTGQAIHEYLGIVWAKLRSEI